MKSDTGPGKRLVTRSVKWMACVLLCGVGLGAVSWSFTISPDKTLQLQITTSQGTSLVQTDVFLPPVPVGQKQTVKCPTVILLHGVEGAGRYISTYSQVARRLNERGYVVCFVHYFDGVPYEDLWHLDAQGNLDLPLIQQACVKDAAAWTSATVEAVCQIAALPEVDSQHMALEGFSLGGYVALDTAAHLAARPELPQVKAVVNNWGAKFEHTEIVSSFPPVLFVHGEHDAVVPLADAQQAQQQILAAGRSASMWIIPGGKHTDTQADSDQATFDFLAQHLTAGHGSSLETLPFTCLVSSHDGDVWQLVR